MRVASVSAVLLLLSTAVVAAPPSFGARSPLHELTVVRDASAGFVGYDIRVTDSAGAVLFTTHVAAKDGEAVDVSSDRDPGRIRVHLSYTPNFFSAQLVVTAASGELSDIFRTWWQLDPRKAIGSMAPPPAAGLHAPDAYRVGGDVKAPVVIRRVDPIYPEEARKARISGIVIVEVLIGRDGIVKDAAVLKPLPYGLDQAALDAVRQWRFEPGTLHGEPVDVLFNLTVNFHLDGKPSPSPPQP